MAHNSGKKFEQAIEKSVNKAGFLYERFKDNGKFGFSETTRFSSENPCDCFIFTGSHLVYLELKSTTNTSISFNQPCDEKAKGTFMIKPHQVKSLLTRAKFPNVVCGLLLDFADRTTSKGVLIEGGTYFIEITTFKGWADSVTKKSINQTDAALIGIKIDRTKLKTNYRYDITKMINDIL